jgi:polysaccharide deacetylase family protein (PEP-CTERM system associated)
MLNALSVDVEDWYMVGAFERTIDRADWPTKESRVERNTDACLALFEEAAVRATFFTLGCVAAAHPALMRRIVAGGHEVASHGWDHVRVFTMMPDQFRADLDRARKTLEDVSGSRVTGYRAPSFSIDARTPWAHQILAEQGYTYSSSVAPLKHDHYGQADAPRYAWKPLQDSALVELPPSVLEVGPKRTGTGGGFFRLLPYAVSRHGVRQVNDAGHPASFYFHPWDIDADQPRVMDAPLRSKLRHYTNLSRMAGKLRRLTRDFAWDRYDRVVEAERARLS